MRSFAAAPIETSVIIFNQINRKGRTSTMTLEMWLVVAILLSTLFLLVTGWLRMDVVALLVLGALAVTGLVGSDVLFDGFSNPAVITVWAMYILSDGLTRTGSASRISRQLMRLSGDSEMRAVGAIMLSSGLMSAFMNNIGVAALMLPVVLEICRRSDHPPSRLLMPLAFGSLLGGLATKIGTPPNLLISDFMREQGLKPFEMFDFAPIGLAVLIGGTAFMMLLGRHLLPRHAPIMDASAQAQRKLASEYGLQEKTFVMRVKPDSVLIGKALGDTHLDSAAGLEIISLIRDDKANIQPQPHTILRPGDRLMVQGRLEQFQELKDWSELAIMRETTALQPLVNETVMLAEVEVAPDSLLVNNTLDYHTVFRRFGVNVLAIRRRFMLRRTNLSSVPLEVGDKLLVQGEQAALEELARTPEFSTLEPLSQDRMEEIYHLNERLFVLKVPAGSGLVGKSLASSRIGDAFDFRILGVFREAELKLMPGPEFDLLERDLLLVQGSSEHLDVLRGLQELEIEQSTANPVRVINSDQVALLELVIAPRSDLAGSRVGEVAFKTRYGVQLLAVWHREEVHRSDFDDVELQYGDAVVVLGTKDKLQVLYEDPDFLPLTKVAFESYNEEKATIAGGIMLLVVLTAVGGLMPISVSAVIGATLMVVLGCLTIDDAYRAIDWRAVFLIAGLLPLGLAMQQTGTTTFLVDHAMGSLEPLGVPGILLGLFLFTSLLTLFVPTAALVVIVAPLAYAVSVDLNLAPEPFIMIVAIAASASLASPVAHPANVLVMAPGGYRFVDYLKVGVPMTLVVLLITQYLLPVVWPLNR